MKPIVTINTYEERETANKKLMKARLDETDNTVKDTEHLQDSKNNEYQVKSPIFTKAQTILTPDYDSTSSNNTVNKYPKSISNIKKILETTQAMANSSLLKPKFNFENSTEKNKEDGDVAEVESIDSFQLTNPYSPTPKPPSVYFNPQSSGPPTMKKKYRPVSVTIGEYDGGNRKDPNKFDFIEKCPVENDSGNDVTDRLRTELQKTLSRSNLKNKNETEEQFNNKGIININSKSSTITNTNNIIEPGLHKTELNIEKITAMPASQRITQQRNQENTTKPEFKKMESTPNGILKSNGAISPSGHSEQKNISFGHVTTVLSDR